MLRKIDQRFEHQVQSLERSQRHVKAIPNIWRCHRRQQLYRADMVWSLVRSRNEPSAMTVERSRNEPAAVVRNHIYLGLT